MKVKEIKKVEMAKVNDARTEAAGKITRSVRQALLRKREAAYRYRDVDGLLLTRKWKVNKLSGRSEIMSMYAIPGPNRKCLCLRFTVFDYATKQFLFVRVYDDLKHLQELDAQVL